MSDEPAKHSELPATSADGLAERLASLESQIGRLTDFLTQQAESRIRRRRKLSLRLLLIAMVVFAGVFAWFSAVYRQSRQQSRAVDHLVAQGAFVMYEPRENMLVSLLPGEVKSPPSVLANSLGADFFRAVTNVSTNNRRFQSTTDKQKLIESIARIEQLERLRLSNVTLRTNDLTPLSSLRNLQSLDLTRASLDRGSLPWLSDSQMRWFCAAHTYLGDQVLKDLSRCPELQHLNIERTTVTENGLQHVYLMKQLRYLNIKRCSVSYAAAKKLSDAMPNCVIDWEPLIFTSDGKVNNPAIRQRRVRFGNTAPADPRASRRAIPPADSTPRSVQNPFATSNGLSAPTIQVRNRSYRSGYMLDAF
ncbi:hypothetical protein [Planctomycetes bacterium K23_9]|uniref:Leucine Rich repeats (2 copies) n=1 Tax=Stieleria marina TaxID=1930275 RepID=A0A517NMZ1_9BACT|nr:hypothetical protein K239x_04020 [Planctomycetes bacterium K23_9]